jgi:hypothetical protein
MPHSALARNGAELRPRHRATSLLDTARRAGFVKAMRFLVRLAPVLALLAVFAAHAAQSPTPLNWAAIDDETMRHFQAIVRMDTSDPPGNEQPVADYLQRALEAEGIEVKVFSKVPHRPNVVARLRGTGARCS